MGQQGLMTTGRVYARMGGAFSNVQNEGSLLAWRGRDMQTPDNGTTRLRIGDWEIVAGAAGRLQIPRIKEDGRAATWQSQQRHVFADSHVI